MFANTSSYVNAVSEIGSNEAPPQLYGGIIADPMGLGKTLTMIALAATDHPMGSAEDEMVEEGDTDKQKHPVSATLIIVPPQRMYQSQPSTIATC